LRHSILTPLIVYAVVLGVLVGPPLVVAYAVWSFLAPSDFWERIAAFVVAFFTGLVVFWLVICAIPEPERESARKGGD